MAHNGSGGFEILQFYSTFFKKYWRLNRTGC